MFKIATDFNVPAKILKPSTIKVNGISQKVFEESETIFISAKSYGGTEKVVDDRLVIEDTLSIETWYRPDITSDCNIKLLTDGSEWEILNTPENIELRNQFLKFKVRRLKGKS